MNVYNKTETDSQIQRANYGYQQGEGRGEGKDKDMGLRYKLLMYKINKPQIYIAQGFPGGASGKEPTCRCRRHKKPASYPWVGRTPWRRA